MKYYKAEEVVKCIADILAEEANMRGFKPQSPDYFKDKACGVLEDLPTIEVSEDCIDRYSALAELDPRSYEYKAVKELPSVLPQPKEGEWIDCNEPPNTERNVFIAHGTDNMKSVCIGHYDHILKQWYEDRNFFAKPIYDGMYWCEIPEFPTIKGADTNCSENPNS